MHNIDIPKLNKILKSQAFADAFGYIVEFDTLDSIKLKFGSNLLNIDSLKKSNSLLYISDDTQMTLFALEGILQSIQDHNFKYNQEKITKAFINWFGTQNYSAQLFHSYLLSQEFLHTLRAPGTTCMNALEQISNSNQIGAFNTSNLINQSKGCGGIMRTMPFAFFAMTPEEAWNYGCEQASITHGHENGYKSAGFYTVMSFFMLKKNLSALSAYEETKQILGDRILSLTPFLDKLDVELLNFSNTQKILNPQDINLKLGKGWTGDEALILAIYCAITSKTFEDMLFISANHNGDSDSIAMLAAGLFAIEHDIPNLEQYFDMLFEKEELSEVFCFFNSKIESIYNTENNKNPSKQPTI